MEKKEKGAGVGRIAFRLQCSSDTYEKRKSKKDQGGKSLRLPCSSEKVLTMDVDSPEPKLTVKGTSYSQECASTALPTIGWEQPRKVQLQCKHSSGSKKQQLGLSDSYACHSKRSKWCVP